MTDFNLSEKIYIDTTNSMDKEFCGEVIDKNDVKEFIRRLKEEIGRREREALEEQINRGLSEKEREWLMNLVKSKITNFIDALAGNKLK